MPKAVVYPDTTVFSWLQAACITLWGHPKFSHVNWTINGLLQTCCWREPLPTITHTYLFCTLITTHTVTVSMIQCDVFHSNTFALAFIFPFLCFFMSFDVTPSSYLILIYLGPSVVRKGQWVSGQPLSDYFRCVCHFHRQEPSVRKMVWDLAYWCPFVLIT